MARQALRILTNNKMAKAKFKLGIEAQDKITGFKGTIVAKTEHITGCDRYCLQPKCVGAKDKNIEIPVPEWFDEGVLEKIGKRVITKKAVTGKKNGAYAPDPF